ncbi:hypothetical protein ACMHYB_13950 [Sorangium sp. So ce1128]
MNYEDAIRYVFDRCGRYGSNGDANTDVFRRAQRNQDWSAVAAALSRAIARIEADSQAIDWATNERANGGVEPNFTGSLRAARVALEKSSSAEAAYVALSLMVHAMKALVLKTGPNVPPPYQGDR